MLAGVVCAWLVLLGVAGALGQPPEFAQVSGSPYATGGFPYSVAFSPLGRLLSVANGDGGVSMFSVALDGQLTQVTGSPFATGQRSDSVAFSPTGRLLASANNADGTVSVFSVASTGTLSPVTGSPYASGRLPFSVAFSPTGRLLATANGASSTVSVFSVASDGRLTQVAGSPFAAGSGPESVAFSPTGGLLATADGASGMVSVFSVASDGRLTQVSGSPFAVGGGPGSVAFSPTGRLFAAADSDGDLVSMFSRGAVSKVEILGRLGFVSPSGIAGILLGCFDPYGCQGSVTISTLEGTTIGHRDRERIHADDGAIVHVTLSSATRRSLARGPLSVTVSVTDTDGPTASRSVTLLPFGATPRAASAASVPAATRATVPSRIEIFGHTGFVSHSGVARIFLGCFGSTECSGAVTLTAGTNPVSDHGAYHFAADSGGIAHVALRPEDRKLLAEHHRLNVLAAVKDTTGPHATATITLQQLG